MTAPVLFVPSGIGQLIASYANGAVTVVGTSIMAPLPVILIVPAGATTGIANGVLTAFNYKGDPYSATNDMELSFEVVASRVVCVAKNISLNLAAPTVVSAQTITGHTDQLAVVFSKAVYLPSLSALSLAYTNGTPRTITGIVSGNGSSQVVLQLSGTTMSSDVFSLVVATPNACVDLNPGLGLIASSTVVTATPGNVPMAIANPLVVNQPLTLYTDVGSGALAITYAASGQIPGSELQIYIPANQRTAVTVPSVPAPIGASINPTVNQTFDFYVLPNGSVLCTVINS